MTSILILGGDWEILFDDETVGGSAVAGMKMVRHIESNTYTTNQLYSAIADATDDFQAMGFENPMLPVTPNAYTMENGYFIPRASTELLDEGAISANWTNLVLMKSYDTPSPGPVASDIGRQVTEATSGDTGTLLDFETLPDGTTVIWIRPDGADTFALATALTTTGDGGAMSVTGVTGAAPSGTTLYSSIQVIGSVPTAAEVYLVQNRFKMTDSIGAFQWWITDSTVSLGIIDILIRVQLNDISIADGDVEVFGRRYTSLYDQFRLNVAAGGRSALPLASSPDINNTTGYFSGGWDAGTGSAMQIGDFIINTFGGKTGGRYVVTAVTDSVTEGFFEWYTTGDLTEFADDDTFTSPNRNGTINTAPVANLTGPTDPASGEGGTVTIAIGTTTFDHDGDAVAEPYSITINAQNDVVASKVYERIKYVTRRGADAADLFGAGVNVPGETYRGLEVQVQYNTPTGTFTEGDDVTGVAGYTARVISVNTSDTYVMLTDQQTSLDAVSATDTLQDEASDSVVAEAPITQFVSPKQSPLGTFTGTQIFGARGVLYINPASADTQNYILTDDNGTQRNPPNTVPYVVNNTLELDRILVARDTGTPGIIDKDQFGGLAAPAGPNNGLADLIIEAAGSVDTQVPASGFIRVVETTLEEEHHYVYDTRTTGAGGEFSLRVIDTGNGLVTTASTSNLIASGAAFLANPQAEIGMLIRNTFAGKTTHVWEIANIHSNTDVAVTQLYGPLDGTQDWDISDTYTINALIGDHTVPTDYAATDDMFDLIIDAQADGTSIQNTLVKELSNNFGTVINVRQGKIILPFTQNPTVLDGGVTVTVVRTPDTIAT